MTNAYPKSRIRGVARIPWDCQSPDSGRSDRREPEPLLIRKKAIARLTFHDSRLATKGVPIPFRHSCLDFSSRFGLQLSCLRTTPSQSTGRASYPIGQAGGQENRKRSDESLGDAEDLFSTKFVIPEFRARLEEIGNSRSDGTTRKPIRIKTSNWRLARRTPEPLSKLRGRNTRPRVADSKRAAFPAAPNRRRGSYSARFGTGTYPHRVGHPDAYNRFGVGG